MRRALASQQWGLGDFRGALLGDCERLSAFNAGARFAILGFDRICQRRKSGTDINGSLANDKGAAFFANKLCARKS